MKSRVVAMVAVICLTAPSALGVQRALEPTRGAVASWLAAIGIELVYLALASLATPPALARHARATALTAVATAIMLNVVADYAARQPDALLSAQAFAARFDALLLALSVIESAPLAGLAYALATLLHRVSAEEAAAPDPPAPPAPSDAAAQGQGRACARCGAPVASQHAAAATARWGCAACRNGRATKDLEKFAEKGIDK